MEFRILGPLQVVEHGRSLPLGGRRQRMVLASLLVHGNEAISTDRLIDDVWGEDPPAAARKSLQAYISRLRKLLGNDTIEAVPSGYVLQVEGDQLDADRFEHLVREGRELLSTDPAKASETIREALQLWHGMPWGDLGDDLALLPDAERLRELRLGAEEDRIEADLALGRAKAVVGELQALISQHPLRERLRGLLMVALYRQGRQAEALRAYEKARLVLADELGIEPSSELQRLEDQVLLQDPTLQGPPLETTPTMSEDRRNPYKGLRPFGEEDAGDFFGREELTWELVERVGAERFVAVVGASGSGKSSVIRAGLIPALRAGATPGSEKWPIAAMVPGAHPFEELEAALLRAMTDPTMSLREQFRGDDLDLLRAVLRAQPTENTKVVLVIDQFEELFLLVEDEQIRSRFIRNLVEAVEDPQSRLTVVVAIRADFFDGPLEYETLAKHVVGGQVTVLPTTPAELGAAATHPATSVGVTLEPELTAALVGDVANEPGSLPLFQFVLTELFQQRRSDLITVGEYRELGGLRGALSRSAEGLYAQLEKHHRRAARQIFLRLVTLGEGHEDTRRRVSRRELESLSIDHHVIDDVLRHFGDARLVTFDRDAATGQSTVEVAHEALLTGWPRLHGWVEDARGDLRLQRSLATEAAEWQAASRDPDFLLTGSHLELYDNWTQATPVALSAAENDFLIASRTRAEELASSEMERERRERRLEKRALRRLQILVVVLAVAAILGSVLTVFAINRATVAQRQVAIDQVRQLTEAAVAQRHTDPELSLLLALAAIGKADETGQPVPGATVAAMHWALQGARVQYPVSDATPGVLSGPDGVQGVYRLGLSDLVAVAQQHVSRGFTPEECRTYFGTAECRLPTVVSSALSAEPLDLLDGGQGQPLAGTSVSLFGDYTDHQAEVFRDEMARFTEETGIRVVYTGSPDFDMELADKVTGPSPPDLLVVAQPASATFAADAGAPDLTRVLDVDALRREQSPYLVSLGTVAADGTWPSDEGGLYAVAFRISLKSLVWYPLPQFHQAGYEIPGSWAELVALTDRMVADGRTPWCEGEGDSYASGWPGTDWIEDLILHDAGPTVYDQWVRHEIAFDSPVVRTAFGQLATLLLQPGHLYGGQGVAANLYVWVAQHPMFDEPPGCWLYHQADFAQIFLPDGIEPGEDTAFFPFPAIDPRYENSVLGGADFLIAITDRPEVREAVRFMTRPDFGVVLANELPGYISPNASFPLSNYQNQLTRLAAQTLRQALEDNVYRFDGSDLMPLEVGGGSFWDAMVRYIGEGPDNLDELLAGIDAGWPNEDDSAP